MSSLGSAPPVAVPFCELPPPAPPETRSFSEESLHPITLKISINKIRFSFFIRAPSPRLSADLFWNPRTLLSQNDRESGGFHLSVQTAEIRGGKCPQHGRSAPRTGIPAASRRHPAASPGYEQGRGLAR